MNKNIGPINERRYNNQKMSFMQLRKKKEEMIFEIVEIYKVHRYTRKDLKKIKVLILLHPFVFPLKSNDR